MKNQIYSSLLTIILGLSLTACDSSGSGGGGSAVSPFGMVGKTFLYVASFTEDSIWTYSFTPGTVVQTNLIQTIPSGSSSPQLLLVHPSSRFLYAFHNNSPTVVSFKIDPNSGQLSQIAATTLANASVKAAFSPDGSFLYTVSFNGKMDGFSVDSSGGLTELAGFPLSPAGVAFSDLVVASSGKYLLVTDSTHGTVAEYSVSTAGALGYIGQINGLTSANAITLNSSDDVFYIAMSGGVVSYTYDDVGGVAGTTAFNSLGYTPSLLVGDGVDRLFVESYSPAELNSWSTDSSTAVMTAINPYFGLGSFASDLSVDATNQYLAIAESGTDGVRILSLDSAGNPGLAGFVSLPVSSAPSSARFVQILP